MARRPVGPGTPIPAARDPGRTSWGAVAGLMGAGVVAAAQIGGAAAALPVLEDDFGLSSATAAWYLSTVSALSAAGGVLLGWLGQTLGFGRQVRFGLAAIVVADLGGAMVDSLTGLLVARVAEGLGLVMVILAAPPLLSEVSAPTHRRLVAGAWGAYMPVGSGLAALLVPSAIGLVGWRGASVADACVAAAVLLVVLRWVPSATVRRRASVGGLLGAFRSPSVVIIAVVFGLYSAQYLAVVGLLPAALVGDEGLSVAAAGLLGAVVFLVNAPANLLGAYLLHRGAPLRWVISAGCAGMAATVWGCSIRRSRSPCGSRRRSPSRSSQASFRPPSSPVSLRCRRVPARPARPSAWSPRGRASGSCSVRRWWLRWAWPSLPGRPSRACSCASPGSSRSAPWSFLEGSGSPDGSPDRALVTPVQLSRQNRCQSVPGSVGSPAG
ncbi:MFS transporter [Blastococcus brunescens]|uniref:MFS transporter n=1 Tax=Blastococcus brunescens TaxID=1564165 RepID=A0ABZ1B4S7_9ACTN|nr:MFS transporter [Blastococcus sp. BMG 8361]WRL65729.1 MFS transporter [Blastococcus sp. BMG 8361]